MASAPGLAILLSVSVALPALAADELAPPTPVKNVTDTFAEPPVTVSIVDPYRWLEDPTDPAVQRWSDAQNQHTRHYLDALPERPAIKQELSKLILATSPSYAGLKRGGSSLFAMYTEPPKQQPMLTVMDLSADPGTARVVVDPNAINAKGSTAIDWFVPSPDGRLVAVSLSEGGSEDGTLHVFDVGSGKEVDSPIVHVQYPTAGGSLAWRADSGGFWYTRFPGSERAEADRHFYQQVFFHRLHDAPDRDPYAFGRELPDPRVSEILLNNEFDPGGVVALVQKGDGGQYLVYALERSGHWVLVARYEDRIIAAAFGPDHALYLVSRRDAAHSRILVLPPGDLKLADAKVIVPESDGTIAPVSELDVLPFTLTDDLLFVKELVGGPSRVDVFTHAGKPRGELPLPDVAAVGEVVPAGGDSVIYSVETFLRPRYYARFESATGKSQETKLVETSPVSFDDAEVVREFATSKDGTKVPVNIVRKRQLRLDGKNPVLLYGYGGYGISLVPRFLGAERRVWLDGGGVYAIANLRGGGEYGEAWHREGALTHKQNVFDDFYAAALRLIELGYTSPQLLAIRGGSNGGLLMGAEVTQHPKGFRAVVSEVGIYDMLRVELDPNGAFNVTEFGSVKEPDQFRALHAYSPYHHAVAAPYPAILFMTGANDGRVNPMQSRKMTAAVQAATTSGQPVFLRTSADSGHGHGSALSVRIDQYADYLSFLFDQLGMKLHHVM
jgi:prolyl oligopeptidase